MVGDLDTQYAVRYEIRREIRNQLPVRPESELAKEISQTADVLRTSVVQAWFNDATGSHAVHVREDMLKKDGSITHLEFLTPEEAMVRLEGNVVEMDAAIGCKSNKH
jgi:hypothetical protein